MNEGNLSKNVFRTPKASTLVNKAFDLYYGTYHKTTKESSKLTESNKINAFISYCEEMWKSRARLTPEGKQRCPLAAKFD